jgi:hypothetical protein
MVKTYREGVAAKVGHDLVMEVARWSASAGEDGTVSLEADSRSIAVREGLHGVKPLSDKDRADIRRNIDSKVLEGKAIAFRGTARRDGARVLVEGELAIGGASRPVSAALDVDGDRLRGTVELVQSEWGIKPYRGLMGALKVRDSLEVSLDVRLPPALAG